MKHKKRKTVHGLPSSPSYSFQESGNPEKDLKEELQIPKECHVLEKEWEMKRRMLEAEVENLREKCEDLTRECGLMEKNVSLASVEKRAMEDQIRGQREMAESERDVLQKMRECHNELKENHGVMKKKFSVAVSEKLELEKELIKCVRQNEEELKQERNATALLKKEVEDLVHSRVEFEEKMKEKCDALEEESELKRRVYEEEVEVLRDRCEELMVETGVVEGMLSLAYEEKRVMEDEIRTQGEILENQNEVLQGFKEELEKMRESHNQDLERVHNLMQQKLTVAVSEKLVLEKELRKSTIQNEEARKELKGELEKARETYEIELKAKCEELKNESGLIANMLSLASEEKRVMEDEMRTQQELLENQNDVLLKLVKELEKMKECQSEELDRIHDLMQRKLTVVVSEKLVLEKELQKSRMQNEEANKELKGEREFTAQLKKELENLMQSRVEFKEKMKEKCHVLEQKLELKSRMWEEEVDSLRDKCDELMVESGVVESMLSLAYEEKRVVEDEIRTQQEIFDNEKDVLQKSFEEELEKVRECHNIELERIDDLMKKSWMQNEEARKELEAELETTRETYEKELKQQRDSAALVKMEVDNLIHSRVEFEEKMKEKYDVLKQEGELKRKVLEEEVERLKEKCEELKKETGLMTYTISMAYEEKRVMEDEMRTQRDRLENQSDVMHKGFKEELEKMRKCHNEELETRHDLMKRKLSVALLEKLELEKELKESRMQNEEARKEFVAELEKARGSYEKNMKREKDLWKNKLSLAATENKEFVIVLRKEFESTIEFLEGENRCLQTKNVVCKENLKIMEDLLTKRGKDLKDEVEEKETYKKRLKEEHDLFEKHLLSAAMKKSKREEELRKEFEEKIEALEAENRELKKKIETLHNAFVVLEEQLAMLKGVLIQLVV